MRKQNPIPVWTYVFTQYCFVKATDYDDVKIWNLDYCYWSRMYIKEPQQNMMSLFKYSFRQIYFTHFYITFSIFIVVAVLYSMFLLWIIIYLYIFFKGNVILILASWMTFYKRGGKLGKSCRVCLSVICPCMYE